MKTKLSTWIIGALMLFVVMRCTFHAEENAAAEKSRAASAAAAEAALPAAERASIAAARAAASAAQAAEELRFQAAVRVVRSIRASLNNPASFELAETLSTDAGALCVSYRGTNAFNAVILNYAVASPDGSVVNGSSSTVAAKWNRHCAGKSGKDLSHIRHAL